MTDRSTTLPDSPSPDRVPDSIEWVFFDLDGTLWDHESASLEALSRVAVEFGISPEAFIPRFEEANRVAWEQLERGDTNRDRMRVERFEETLRDIAPSKLTPDGVESMSRRYLEMYLETPNRFWLEGGRAVLDAVSGSGCRVALLTNGFADTQMRKIEEAGESHCVEFVWGPDEAGCLKPDVAFFETALERAGCSAEQALMIGDSLRSDILASLEVGMEAWWYNPNRVIPPSGTPGIPTVVHLNELLPLFRNRGVS